MRGSGENIARLEALLFYYGEPIEMKKIGAVLGLKDKEAEELCQALSEVLDKREGGGLRLLRKGDRAQLVTKAAYGDILQRIVEEELREELTSAALETLSIIAYLGPLTRAELDYVRGVNSSFILRSLILRGLVERKESRKRGGFYDYEASFNFLRHVGLERVEQLPEYAKYRGILSRLQPAEEVEGNKTR